MKSTRIIVLAVLLIGLLASASVVYPKLKEKYTETTTEIATAEPASALSMAGDFSVYDIDGNEVRLSDYRGKPVIVNFWATWCKYCVEELPSFNRAYTENKDEINFLMIDLCDGDYETKEGALSFIEESGLTFPAYFDTENNAGKVYNLNSIPLTLIIDRDGNLVKEHLGLMDESTLNQYIEMLK